MIPSIELKRSYTSLGVWGLLHMPSGVKLATMERAWEDNKPSVSCIPEGEYLCKRVNSPKFGDTFEVTSVPDRSHILFHKGNDAEHHSLGCILVGTRKAVWNDRIKVGSSKAGMAIFLGELTDFDEFQLTISTRTITNGDLS